MDVVYALTLDYANDIPLPGVAFRALVRTGYGVHTPTPLQEPYPAHTRF